MKDKKLKVVHSNSGVSENETTSEDVQKLYAVLEELPKPPTAMKLTAAQKKWWYWFGVEFLKTKQLSQLDLVHLQNAAVSLDARCKMVEIINQKNKEGKNGVEGWVQKFASGATNVTGYQTMYEKATKQLEEVSAHFGLSFRDRKKIEVEESTGNQLSLFDQVLQKMYSGS